MVRCIFCRAAWSEAHTCARLAARTSGIREVAPDGELARLYAFPTGPPPLTPRGQAATDAAIAAGAAPIEVNGQVVGLLEQPDLKHQVLSIGAGAGRHLEVLLRCVACEGVWTAFRGEGVTCPACGHPGS